MSLPLHEQVAAELRRLIAVGELAVGEPVPSEAQLCQHWQSSRGPIRQALTTLRAEGLIGGGRGKPPVVRRRTVSQSFDTFVSFSRWADSIGRHPGQHTIEIALRPATAELADLLNLDEGEQLVQVLRLRLLDDEPTMLERTSFISRYGRLLLDHDLDSGSIYGHLVDQGLRIGVARHLIDAVGADDVASELLGIDAGTPLLRERRLAYTSDGNPFEYSEDCYRPDLVTFTIDNQPHGQPSLGRSWSMSAQWPDIMPIAEGQTS